MGIELCLDGTVTVAAFFLFNMHTYRHSGCHTVDANRFLNGKDGGGLHTFFVSCLSLTHPPYPSAMKLTVPCAVIPKDV